MGEAPADLSGLSWRDDLWLQCYGIHPANALDYFALSPFYDRSCNNEVARLRGLSLEQLGNAPGLEYTLQDAQPPHLFVIRRSLRAASAETVQTYYYILDGTIYQAPSLHAVFSTRLQRCRHSFQAAFREIQNDLHPLDEDAALDTSLRAEIRRQDGAGQRELDAERAARIDGGILNVLSQFPLPQLASQRAEMYLYYGTPFAILDERSSAWRRPRPTTGDEGGFVPASFSSARGGRFAPPTQNVEAFLDEDELRELHAVVVEVTPQYDTFGAEAGRRARAVAAREASARPSAIPGLLPDELLKPVASSAGVRLLERLGWRQGTGVGKFVDERSRQREGGMVATQAGTLPTSGHPGAGIGYDPFRGAEDLRGARGGVSAARVREQRGIAFGAAQEDEEDDYEGLPGAGASGVGDLGGHRRALDARGLPTRRVVHGGTGRGDRLLSAGYAFEVQDGPEAEPKLLLQLGAGREEFKLLGSGQEETTLLGFSDDVEHVRPGDLPHPDVPPTYDSSVVPSQDDDACRSDPGPRPPSPKGELRARVDLAAFEVASGDLFSKSALRAAHAGDPCWEFLRGGEGSRYFDWKIATLRNVLGKPAEARRAACPPRSAGPLDASQRGALLGERPAGAAARGGATAATATATEGVVASTPPTDTRGRLAAMSVDAANLSSMLKSSFVRGEVSEGAQTIEGLRPGARQITTEPRDVEAGLRGAFPDQVVTARDLTQAPTAWVAGALRAPVRVTEEWMPTQLLCRRFGVPDPYHGRPAKETRPKFRTDLIGAGGVSLARTNAQGLGSQNPVGLPAVSAAQEVPPPPPPVYGDVTAETEAFLSELARDVELNPNSPTAEPAGMGPEPAMVDLFEALFGSSDEDGDRGLQAVVGDSEPARPRLHPGPPQPERDSGLTFGLRKLADGGGGDSPPHRSREGGSSFKHRSRDGGTHRHTSDGGSRRRRSEPDRSRKSPNRGAIRRQGSSRRTSPQDGRRLGRGGAAEESARRGRSDAGASRARRSDSGSSRARRSDSGGSRARRSDSGGSRARRSDSGGSRARRSDSGGSRRGVSGREVFPESSTSEVRAGASVGGDLQARIEAALETLQGGAQG